MIDWMSTLLIAGIIVLSCMYSYSFMQLLLSITKCPDCGRIMQKVKYQNVIHDEDTAIYCECHFCQAKQLRPSHPGKKLTLHP